MGRPSTAARATPASRAELDELTLRRAQQGERAALELLVERYHPLVHALVWRMACAQGEIVQDSLGALNHPNPRYIELSGDQVARRADATFGSSPAKRARVISMNSALSTSQDAQ